MFQSATTLQMIPAEDSIVEKILSNKHYLDISNKRPLTAKVRQFEIDVYNSKKLILDEHIQS